MPPEEKNTVVLKPGEVVVSQADLTKILEGQATLEKKIADSDAEREGLKALFEAGSSAGTVGEEKLRERKNFEPAFRTVRIRKFPIGGNPEKLGYVIGWSDRGAYQKVDRSGVSPQLVDYIDIFFLDTETGQPVRVDGKLQAESVPLLELLNRGVQIHCKVLDLKKETNKVKTGEEINVTVWDPQHGLTQTGDVIDGYVGVTDLTYTIQIPGLKDPVIIDGKYVN